MTHEEKRLSEMDRESRSRWAGGEPACASPPLRSLRNAPWAEGLATVKLITVTLLVPQGRQGWLTTGTLCLLVEDSGLLMNHRGTYFCTNLQEQQTPGHASSAANLPSHGRLGGRAQGLPTSSARSWTIRRARAPGTSGPGRGRGALRLPRFIQTQDGQLKPSQKAGPSSRGRGSTCRSRET